MQRNKISFKGQKIFIGIDVHKKNWDVAIAPKIGKVKRHSQKASAKELFVFLMKHYPDGDYLAVYESGFSGYSTYYALKEFGIECMVIHTQLNSRHLGNASSKKQRALLRRLFENAS